MSRGEQNRSHWPWTWSALGYASFLFVLFLPRELRAEIAPTAWPLGFIVGPGILACTIFALLDRRHLAAAVAAIAFILTVLSWFGWWIIMDVG